MGLDKQTTRNSWDSGSVSVFDPFHYLSDGLMELMLNMSVDLIQSTFSSRQIFHLAAPFAFQLIIGQYVKGLEHASIRLPTSATVYA